MGAVAAVMKQTQDTEAFPFRVLYDSAFTKYSSVVCLNRDTGERELLSCVAESCDVCCEAGRTKGRLN